MSNFAQVFVSLIGAMPLNVSHYENRCVIFRLIYCYN